MRRAHWRGGIGTVGRAAIAAAVACMWCAVWGGSSAAATARVAPARAPVLGPNGNTPVDALPQVTSDAAGDAVAVWWGDKGDGTAVVQAASRPAGGAWQPPVNLSAPMNVGCCPEEPRVAIDTAGDAVAVWDNGIVQAASRPAGGAWQPAVTLSASGHVADESRVAISPTGLAIAVWRDQPSGSVPVVQAAMRPLGGVWQTPVVLTTPGVDGERPQVAVNKTGAAVAVWESDSGSGSSQTDIVQASTRSAAGIWRAPVNLSASSQQCCFFPQVAIDQAGHAVAVWERGLAPGEGYVAEAAVRPATGSAWQAPRTLSTTHFAMDPQVAMGPTGLAIAGWEEFIGSPGTGREVVRAATRPPGGSFGAPVTLSAPDPAHPFMSAPRLAVSQGIAIAVWERSNGTTDGPSFVAQAAARPAATGVWQAPVNLAAPSETTLAPQVALDAAGNATAVWQRRSDADTIVQASSRPLARGVWQAPLTISIPMTTLVPEVTGLPKGFAGQQVTAAGLVPRFTGAVTANPSWVATETPAAGTLLPRGSTVTLFLKPGEAP